MGIILAAIDRIHQLFDGITVKTIFFAFASPDPQKILDWSGSVSPSPMTPKLDLPAVADDTAQLLDVQYIDIIQTVIGSLDPNHTAMVSGGDNGRLWKFSYGSVEVFVQLSGETDEDILTVWADVLALPVKNQADLLEKLLEMNWDRTLEARFAISDNRVVAMSTRSVAELSPGEISRAITLVADVADANDDDLQAAFPPM
jgi:hypothetical protein